MNLSNPLSLSHELKAGDRVFLRFNATTVLGRPIAQLINAWASQFESLRVRDFELEGFPVYDPVAGTVNMIVRVHGTPLHVVIAVIVGIGVLGLVLREARLILSATAGAIKDVGQGVGFGFALAGVVAAAFVLGWLDLRG